MADYTDEKVRKHLLKEALEYGRIQPARTARRGDRGRRPVQWEAA